MYWIVLRSARDLETQTIRRDSKRDLTVPDDTQWSSADQAQTGSFPLPSRLPTRFSLVASRQCGRG